MPSCVTAYVSPAQPKAPIAKLMESISPSSPSGLSV